MPPGGGQRVRRTINLQLQVEPMAREKTKSHAQVRKDLAAFFKEKCPGSEVAVEQSDRWKRRCITVTWKGFAGLLLEERFRLVAKLVPADYFRANCADAVWLELTPGESIESYLAQPRSEDVDDRLDEIWKALGGIRFFEALEDELVRIPPNQASDDLSVSRRVLAAKKASADLQRDALLAFMRQQAYNDWEVLREVRPVATGGKGKK